MARIFGRPVGREVFMRMPRLDESLFAEARVNQGMITMIDSADLPPAALQLAKNTHVRFDKTSRRFGSVLLTPVKPDSEPVLKLAFIKRNNGDAYTIRMTPTTIHTLGAGVWNAFAGPALGGGVNDRFQTAVVLDDFIFSNNGVNVLQRLNFGSSTYANLGNAPSYRYVVGFNNRAVGAALRDINEVQVGWSADGDIDEWDNAVDNTAGNSPIMESPSDLSDFITGLFASANVGILLRERSIWNIIKQPAPTNPFYFQTAVPNIGCDCPFSACRIDGGIAWLDRRTRTVYAYSPGGQPEPIGRPIEKTILDGVSDVRSVFSGYDSLNNEYHICIPQVGSNFVLVWTYNLRNKAWTRNDYYALTSVDNTDLAVAGTQIDQLGDVPIDSLTGTIDDLSPTSTITPTLSLGRDDGTIAIVDENVDVDAPHTDYPNGYNYETIIRSKTFFMPRLDMYVSSLVIEYEMKRAGSFLIQFSKNGGATDDSWVTAKTVTPTKLGEPQILRFKRSIRARRFAWQIVSSSGAFDILNYEVTVSSAGEITK